MYHVSCHHVLQVGNIRFLQPSLMFLRLNCARKSRCFLVTLWFVSTAIVQSWGGGSPPHEHCQHSFSHSAVKTILGINIVWGNPETVTCAPTRDSNEGYPKARNHGEGPRAFSVITNLRMDLLEALAPTHHSSAINQNSSQLQRISLAQWPPVLIFSCKTNIYGEKFAFYSSIKQKHFIVRAFGNSLMIDVCVWVV